MSSLSELEQHGSETPSEGVSGSAPAIEGAAPPSESDETGQRAVLGGGDTATDLTPPEPALAAEASLVAPGSDTTTEHEPANAQSEPFENFTVDRVIAPPSLVLLPSFAPVVTREAEPEPALPDYVLLHSEPTHPQPAPFTVGENSFDSGSMLAAPLTLEALNVAELQERHAPSEELAPALDLAFDSQDTAALLDAFQESEFPDETAVERLRIQRSATRASSVPMLAPLRPYLEGDGALDSAQADNPLSEQIDVFEAAASSFSWDVPTGPIPDVADLLNTPAPPSAVNVTDRKVDLFARYERLLAADDTEDTSSRILADLERAMLRAARLAPTASAPSSELPAEFHADGLGIEPTPTLESIETAERQAVEASDATGAEPAFDAEQSSTASGVELAAATQLQEPLEGEVTRPAVHDSTQDVDWADQPLNVALTAGVPAVGGDPSTPLAASERKTGKARSSKRRRRTGPGWSSFVAGLGVALLAGFATGFVSGRNRPTQVTAEVNAAQPAPALPPSVGPLASDATAEELKAAPAPAPETNLDSADSPRTEDGSKPSASARAAVAPALNAPSSPAREAKSPLDQKTIQAALSKAAARASTCVPAGEPGGTATATVTFVPSGRATNIGLSNTSFGGSYSSQCIRRILKDVRVPAFAGAPVTVRKTIRIE